jgi:hypothetical protein
VPSGSGKTSMTRTLENLEYSTAQDLYYDFCLWEYRPRTPCDNKLRSSNLLFHSFEFTGLDERISGLIQAIREGFGVSHTVWGLKKIGDDIRWEFYFYDYRRVERERSITKLLRILQPYARCPVEVNEKLHYFMFSIDIDDALVSGKRDLDEIHMYIGNPGSTVSSGICYSLKSGGTRLENYYFFFDAAKQQKDIVIKAMTSAYLDVTVVGLDQVFWPEMRNCEVIVVANKQGNDAVYFSRINVDQLIFFMRKLGYPKDLLSFAEENRSRLDHLLFDVGYDYRMEGKDLLILKSGYYGVF